MALASGMRSSCFEVVPLETRPWKPEIAPQAMVMKMIGKSGGAPEPGAYGFDEVRDEEGFVTGGKEWRTYWGLLFGF